MRTIYAAVAFFAALAGTCAIAANVTGVGSTGTALAAKDPASSLDAALTDGGIRRAPGPAFRSGEMTRARHSVTRLAQIKPYVNAPEASTGNPSLPPLKWVGLLVVPNPTKNNPNQITTCTGQFITPNVVLTAGHCLRDLPDNPNGPWPDITKGTFWLQYQNDEGTPFKILCGATNPLWTLPANYGSLTTAQKNAAMNTAWQHDFAMFLVDGKSPTGVMPYALDWKGKVSQVVRVGYPGAILDAAIVQQAAGPVFFADQIPMGPDTLPNIVVQWAPLTDFTQGSSGGAWVANFSTVEGPNNNILIAVTSFNSGLFPGAMFAAYLTAAEFNPLLISVSNGCK